MVEVEVNEQFSWARSIYDHPGDRAVWWVDAAQPGLFRFTPHNRGFKHWHIDRPTSFALPVHGRRDDFVVGLNSGLGLGVLCEDRLEISERTDITSESEETGVEAGVADYFGRLWFITRYRSQNTDLGDLHIYQNGIIKKVYGRLPAPYDVAASENGRTIYVSVIDENAIYRMEVGASGSIMKSDKLIVFDREEGGYPAGITVDSSNHLWVCRYGIGAIDEIDERGNIVQQIEMPVKTPTDCCFGGMDFRTLYVCSAASKAETADGAFKEKPGSVFALHGLATGLPSRYAKYA